MVHAPHGCAMAVPAIALRDSSRLSFSLCESMVQLGYQFPDRDVELQWTAHVSGLDDDLFYDVNNTEDIVNNQRAGDDYDSESGKHSTQSNLNLIST